VQALIRVATPLVAFMVSTVLQVLSITLIKLQIKKIPTDIEKLICNNSFVLISVIIITLNQCTVNRFIFIDCINNTNELREIGVRGS
jgi:hypothetical protein